MGVQGVVASGLDVALAAVNIDVLLGDKALARSRNLDRGYINGIADADEVRCVNTVVLRVDSHAAAPDIDNALALDDVLAFTVDFFAFVALQAVAILGRKVKRGARNLEAALALDGILFGFDGDDAVLNLEVVAALDAVLELALHGKRARALDVEVVPRIDGCLRSVLRAIDLGEQVVAVTVFHHVGGALHQVEHRLVGVCHQNGGVRTLDGRVVEVDAGVALVFGTRGVHHDLEVRRFAGHVVGARASDGGLLVGYFDASVVVLDRGRGARKLQEDLGAVQGARIFVVVFVVAVFSATGIPAVGAGYDAVGTSSDAVGASDSVVGTCRYVAGAGDRIVRTGNDAAGAVEVDAGTLVAEIFKTGT